MTNTAKALTPAQKRNYAAPLTATHQGEHPQPAERGRKDRVP
jgi:hypothetical protein